MTREEFDGLIGNSPDYLINPDLVGARRAPLPSWTVTLGNGRVSVSFCLLHDDVGHVVKVALRQTLQRPARRLLEALLEGL